MKIYQKLVMPAVVLAMAAPLIAYSAGTSTAEKTDRTSAGAPAKPAASDKALLKFSEAGNSAMRAIRVARFAIFNGEPKDALAQMASARTFLDQAENEAPTFDTKTTVSVGGKVVGTTEQKNEARSIPFDGQLVLADDFVPTPEKKAHIDKANEHFKQGDQKKALEELRLGEIDVNFTRSWLPLTRSKAQLATAIKLAGDGKYYEANLALKAIEDSVTVNSVALRDLPRSPAS